MDCKWNRRADHKTNKNKQDIISKAGEMTQ